MNCFSDSIHAPGFGTHASDRGKIVSNKYGVAIPSARNVKISSDTYAGCCAANPSADPMNGAVHGVAATVASAPFRNDDTPPCVSFAAFASTPTSDVPISKTPNKFSPSKKNKTINPATNPGDCIWKPHPK